MFYAGARASFKDPSVVAVDDDDSGDGGDGGSGGQLPPLPTRPAFANAHGHFFAAQHTL